MMDATKTRVATHCTLFLSLVVAALLAAFAPRLVQTEAGAWAVGILALVFVATLLVLTSIASFVDTIENNSFSYLLRKSTLETTFYPWALAAYMGRWFHPLDGLESPLGAWGPVLLMAATWGMVVLGDVMRRRGRPLWPWLVVTLGFIVGSLTWPA